MERALNVLRDLVLVACAVITALFTIYPAASVSATPPIPWWVAAVFILGVVLALTKWGPGLVRMVWGSPFEFFPDRNSLQKAHGSLADRLEKVENASAIWVIGQKFYHAEENTDRIKKLLLPNPSGESFKFLISTGPFQEAADMIHKITTLAKNKGAEVRWYDHFICHSIVLADVNKHSGWAHIESVFPYSTTDQRPSYTIYRRSNRKAVAEMARIFDTLWGKSKKQ